MDSDTTAAGFDSPRAVQAGGGGPSLAPYRNWALQNNLASVFDSGTTWRESPAGLGLDENDPLGERRGQGALLKELEPDPELRLRTNTLLLMLGSALAVHMINQLTPVGIKMSTNSFVIMIVAIVAAMIFTASIFPRLTRRSLAIVGQIMLIYAFAVIAFQCSETGGAESPYAVWWLFVVFHSAYFLERGRAFANVVAITLAALLPLAYDDTAGQSDTLVTLALLITVIWMLTITIVSGRELARRAERAVRYLALADSLTGVANLRAFEGFVESAVRSGRQRFALILADVNGLKGANAAFGYEIGDDMLNRLAALMRHACDEQSQVARVRGDEFAVLLPGGDDSAAREWIERFERAVADHNEWVLNRLPQISVALGVSCYPRDGTRPSRLFDVADQRMFEQKSPAVSPPHEVEISTSAGAHHFQRPVAEEFDPRPKSVRRAALHSAARWLVAGLAFGAYALAPGDSLQSQEWLLAIAALSLLLALAGLGAQLGWQQRPFFVVSDITTLVIIVPVLFSTGGWQSPFLLATFFPLAFYAQFLTGRQATFRAAAAVGFFSIAFWLSIAVGAAPAPVSAAAQTLFVTIITAQVLITLILQSNRQATVDAIRTIRDAATHDPLTGAGNIHAFRVDLGAMVAAASYKPAVLSRGAPAGVAGFQSLPTLVVVDIDDFRTVNNSGGHLAGDAVLKAVGERLKKNAGDDGTVYRIDCDEYAVLFKADSHALAADHATRLAASLTINAPAGFDPLARIRVSYGHAVWREGATAEQLVEEAEAAMASMRALHGVDSSRGGAMLL